ncbi:hypothetical protein QJS10_CPA05g02274 [Acorus calamus]|uniref:Uncharacterized protein n=1 Tax=Acorus calamus TaxID=4465 RepID=A0AAV9EV54_ACOCL|nr:hypothetical protein QJS10_CPA05g02274 [Acorus calamus]
MYENKARLLCTAEAYPTALFDRIVTVSDAQKMAPRTSSRSRRNDDANVCVDNELGFAKDRTISRLTEMNSKEYLERHAAKLSGEFFQDTSDLYRELYQEISESGNSEISDLSGELSQEISEKGNLLQA